RYEARATANPDIKIFKIIAIYRKLRLRLIIIYLFTEKQIEIERRRFVSRPKASETGIRLVRESPSPLTFWYYKIVLTKTKLWIYIIYEIK
ncbi:MAG: hypothetical protein ACD_71C00233G0001, partial [uncultured bacterium (gcode 4)]